MNDAQEGFCMYAAEVARSMLARGQPPPRYVQAGPVEGYREIPDEKLDASLARLLPGWLKLAANGKAPRWAATGLNEEDREQMGAEPME